MLTSVSLGPTPMISRDRVTSHPITHLPPGQNAAHKTPRGDVMQAPAIIL